MLQYVATFGPMLCFFGAIAIAVLVLQRRQSPRLLGWRAWLASSSPRTQALVEAAIYFVSFCAIALLVLPAALLHFTISGIVGTPWYWLWMALVFVLGAFARVLIFPPYKEPEDWLLWDKERR
jgi:hypothetical protein